MPPTRDEAKIAEAKSKFISTSTNATAAIRKKYKPTQISLGKGAFGQVFLFHSLDGKQNYAVKILLKELMPDIELELIKEEIAILSSLDHPNVVNYIESFEDDRYLYLVMENIEGAIELRKFTHKLESERTDPTQPIMPEKDAARIMLMFA